MTRLTSSNPESKYMLEENASYKFRKAVDGSPEIRPGETLAPDPKHKDFTDTSINYRVFNRMHYANIYAKDQTCTLNELQTSIVVTGMQGYLRELNKMGILRMVSE